MPDPTPTYTPLVWDQTGERIYETGVDNGVVYPFNSSTNQYGEGVAWSGLSGVTEKPSGAEPSPIYADNIEYANIISNEKFGATVEAYTFPDAFAECDGSATIATGVYIGQQKRKMFGLSYRTKIGNDVDGNDHGFKYHLVYGCFAQPTEKGHKTIGDTTEPETMSWELTATPIEVTGKKPTAHIVIDTTKVNDDTKITALKNKLYGTTTTPPTMPTISDLLTIFGTGNG